MEYTIRKRSRKERLKKPDLETIYENRIYKPKIYLRDDELFVNNNDPARLSVVISNKSDVDMTYISVLLIIMDINGNELSTHRMQGFEYQNGEIKENNYFNDHAFALKKKCDLHGNALFRFTSGQAVDLGLSELGESEEFKFSLYLWQDDQNKYTYDFPKMYVFTKGSVLHKVVRKRKK